MAPERRGTESNRGFVTVAVALAALNSLGADDKWVQKRVEVVATSYCAGPCCCGKFADGKTATGRDAKRMGVAVDPSVIPLGARLDIPGYGNWKLADDVGGAIKGNRIDVRFQDHDEAKRWGVKRLTIRVWRKHHG